MPSFTTINDPVNKGAGKYDNYATLAEAEARIVELADLGYTDAFIIDDDATAINGIRCFQTGKHWAIDAVAKTVTLDQASFDAEVLAKNMEKLRQDRNLLLTGADHGVEGAIDRGEDPTAWRTYRQALRDLPANTADPAAPVWPIL